MTSPRGSGFWEPVDRIAAGLFAVFGAGALVSKAAGGPTWLLIALAAVGLLGLILRAVFVVLAERAHWRETWRALLARDPLLVRELRPADFLSLGVDAAADEALRELDEPEAKPPRYLPRDIDDTLRASLAEAAGQIGAQLVVLTGHSKAGKSRTALEAASAALGDCSLLVPVKGRPTALSELASHGSPVAGPVVIWLDDLEPWARPDGLSSDTLAQLDRWRTAVIVLATAFGKGVQLAGQDAKRFHETLSDLLARARRHPLPSSLTGSEHARFAERYDESLAERIAPQGIGEFMIAAPRLVTQLEYGANRVGRAIMRAAIDCRRTGYLDPIPESWLHALLASYHDEPVNPDAFADGLRWATEPVYESTRLLSPVLQASDEATEVAYEPYDYLVEYRAQAARIPTDTWTHVIAHAAPVFLNEVGFIAHHTGEDEHAEAAWRRGDEHDNSDAATNLGALLHERGDRGGAEAIWRRGDEGGNPNAAYNLGVLLRERGDLDGAEAAWRRGDEGGNPNAAYNLGLLLHERGDLDGAEAAYRRGDERGHPRAANNLGVLLRERGDLDGAEAAYRRGDERGDPDVANILGVLLHERGDLDGAEAAWRRGDERGDPDAANNLGVLLHERGDLDGAEAAYRRSDERGDADAAYNLGLLLHARGDLDGAEAAYRRGDERGHPGAANNLGVLLRKRGDLDGAEAAYRRGDKRGSSAAANNLGVLLHARGDLDGAEAAWRRGAQGGNREAANNLSTLLRERGDPQ